MIYYFLRAQHANTVNPFLRDWQRSLARSLQIVSYESLSRFTTMPKGTYIFTDIDRLSPLERQIVAEVWTQLEAYGPEVRLMNHPLRVLNRYDLLRKLYELGINEYNVYRLSETRTPERFPVFLRLESDHNGPKSPLIQTQSDLDRACLEAVMMGLDPNDVMIVEYSHSADEHGWFRKYDVYRVGDRFIARNLHVNDTGKNVQISTPVGQIQVNKGAV